ncbi:hypothetical protein FHU34_114414 [Micromonospora taraxaci]|uniref:Uncharacterized protein n=1 Tax=Micromonospora taraxaci TaxID=1316803 RepID=A0A561W5A5_9ACTN|nr:hypothetical protein FHU34_114414 [Micromonospora taraxaci]
MLNRHSPFRQIQASGILVSGSASVIAGRARTERTERLMPRNFEPAGPSSTQDQNPVSLLISKSSDNSAFLADVRNVAAKHYYLGERGHHTSPKGHNMRTLQDFRSLTHVEWATRMRPTACSSNFYAPQPRVSIRNAAPLLGQESAGTRKTPMSSPAIQDDYFRPDKPQRPQHLVITAINERLDVLRTRRVDEHSRSMNSATLHSSHSDPRHRSVRDPERTYQPCPPHPHTASDTAPPGGRQPAGRVTGHRLPDCTNTLGWR